MIEGSIVVNNLLNKDIVLCDWDGVIQDIDVKWASKLIDEYYIYKKYLDFSKLTDKKSNRLNPKLVLNRDTYYIDNWLKRDDIEELPQYIKEDFIKLYIEDEDFYEDCPFLSMASSLKTLVSNGIVSKVIFLSSAPEGILTDERKEKMMKKFFNDSRFSIRIVPGNEKKSEFIKKNNIRYDVYIDDRSDVIRDIIDNSNSLNKQFILPFYMYNKELGNDIEYLSKLERMGIRLSTYVNKFI